MNKIIILSLFIILLFFLKRKNRIDLFQNYTYTCPKYLMVVVDKILAYYDNKQMLQGNNPIIFNSLKEYQKYMEHQNKKGLFEKKYFYINLSPQN